MKVGVLIEFTSNTDIDAKFAELKEMGVDTSGRCYGRGY